MSYIDDEACKEDITKKLNGIVQFLNEKYDGVLITEEFLSMVKFEIEEMLKTYIIRVLHREDLKYSLKVSVSDTNGFITANIIYYI